MLCNPHVDPELEMQRREAHIKDAAQMGLPVDGGIGGGCDAHIDSPGIDGHY